MRKIYNIAEVPRYTELQERFIFPYSTLNYYINGGVLDRVTMITSSTDNGKTTLTSDIIRSVIEQGYNVASFFGEDTPRESRDRIYKQATKYSKENIIYKPYIQNGKQTNCGEYFLSDEAFAKAEAKFKDKLFLYNTKADASVDDILQGFEEARIQHNCRVYVIDNVEQFAFSSDNENKAIKDIVIKIRDYAINNKVHIFLVAHLRKTERDVILPDLNDVKGTSAMVNIAKNVIIVLRTDKIDHNSKQYKSLKELLALNNYDLDKADCLLYLAKTKGRRLGYVCLKFDKITNNYYECRKIDETKKDNEEPIMNLPSQPKLEEVDIDFGDPLFS